MRLASFAIGLVLLGGPALAATGDALIVTGDGVNVRAGPNGDAAIRMRVYRDQQVIELQREGEWVRAEIAGTDGQEGWIHSSLLAHPDGEQQPDEAPVQAPSDAPAPPADEAAARPGTEGADVPLLVEPAAGPDAPGELARFRDTVTYLNERALAIDGVDLFSEVKPGAEGIVQVVATDAWSTIPPAGRQSYANTLLDRWAAAKEGAGPVAVQILDPNGEVVMEKKAEPEHAEGAAPQEPAGAEPSREDSP
jgi:Bacterial SH3 domain